MTALAQTQLGDAADLAFDTWPPVSLPVRHGVPAPLGAIRLVPKGKSVHRQIKVRMHGRPRDRWMKLARYWWLRNMGPIPAGKVVGHVDGDSMNDDPHNYALMTTGDTIACWHMDNPDASERQHRRAARATARANRERAAVERGLRWLGDRWYAVDPQHRVIYVDRVYRERWQVYAAWGIAGVRSVNGRPPGAALGWMLPVMQAAVLSALADGPLRLRTLWERVNAIYRHQHWPAVERATSLHLGLGPLKRRGWVSSTRSSRGRAVYTIMPAALEARGPICPIVAVLGTILAGDRAFYQYTRNVHGREGVAA